MAHGGRYRQHDERNGGADAFFKVYFVKILRFCDKNVVHFYYLPRLFGEYKLLWLQKTHC